MKKLILFLTVLALVILPFGAQAAQPQQDSDSAGQAQRFIPGSVPAQTDLSQSMRPAIHALVLTMAENDLSYDQNSELFFWTGMYYMLSLYGEMDDRAELTDDTLILPTETVQDYAAALFPNRQGLPALPKALSDRITYRAADGTYRLARGDEGLAEVQLQSSRVLSGGLREIEGKLVYLEDGSTLATFRVELEPQDSMFGYSISDMTMFG